MSRQVVMEILEATNGAFSDYMGEDWLDDPIYQAVLFGIALADDTHERATEFIVLALGGVWP
jgi:hypothetical protein